MSYFIDLYRLLKNRSLKALLESVVILSSIALSFSHAVCYAGIHFSTNLNGVLSWLYSHEPYYTDYSWMLIVIVYLFAIVFPRLMVYWMAGFKKETAIEACSWVGAFCDFLRIALCGYYAYVATYNVLATIQGINLHEYHIIRELAICHIVFLCIVFLFAMNRKRFYQVFDSRNRETHFCDANGNPIFSNSRVSYRGREYEVVYMKPDWELIYRFGNGKSYKLEDAVMDQDWKVILIDEH